MPVGSAIARCASPAVSAGGEGGGGEAADPHHAPLLNVYTRVIQREAAPRALIKLAGSFNIVFISQHVITLRCSSLMER